MAFDLFILPCYKITIKQLELIFVYFFIYIFFTSCIWPLLTGTQSCTDWNDTSDEISFKTRISKYTLQCILECLAWSNYKLFKLRVFSYFSWKSRKWSWFYLTTLTSFLVSKYLQVCTFHLNPQSFCVKCIVSSTKGWIKALIMTKKGNVLPPVYYLE